ncbi:ATP-binding protein [Actinacidiphila sp. DG2A-62]|uniref:ATP-binding protein n=1 Tax=Actinacidiphila sp. DG2A-62 TaxID=3108821 RepID=UPI002DB9AB4B|nr:ATP-binding protein [Actinacidiphila sp. DG2A-62]MEC3994961.1 ATP-binding protein [Actinacidiphila sp. DG2A-62]
MRSLRVPTAPAPAGPLMFGENFPRVAASAPAARHLVQRALLTWGMSLDGADVVVSELISNAIRHAEGEGMRVSVARLDEAVVRVAVIDRSSTAPALQHLTQDSETGRGLWLVESLSAAWGVHVLRGGKCVWAELREAGA